MNVLALLLALGIVSMAPAMAATVMCNLKKIEADFDNEKIQESKKCMVYSNASNTETNTEQNLPDENCKIIHELTTTEIKLKNSLDVENKVTIELNNMNEEKPLKWEIRVDINNKPKTLIHLGSEKIDVACSPQTTESEK